VQVQRVQLRQAAQRSVERPDQLAAGRAVQAADRQRQHAPASRAAVGRRAVGARQRGHRLAAVAADERPRVVARVAAHVPAGQQALRAPRRVVRGPLLA